MSLLGRLEDLPITDILQIVFLSRRTGILEIVRGDAKSQVLFQRGLIVGARSTAVSDLGDEMVLTGTLTPDQAELARKASAKPPITPLGQSLTDLGLVSVEGLGDAVLSMLRRVVEPLIGCEDGEFNFVLREGLDAAEIGYEPELVFRDKGVSPQKLLAKDGEKIVPLKALQDQMRTGKLMMSQRGMSVDDGRRGRESQVIDVPEVPPPAAAEAAPAPAETPSPAEAEAPPTRVDTGPLAIPRPTLDFVEISATEEDLASIGPLQLEEAPVETPVAPAVSVVVAGAEEERRRAFEDRTVVILEPDPLVRVAVKRVLGRKGVRTFHFNDPGEVLRTIRELYDDGKFFVTILGFDAGVTAETLKDLEASRLLEFVRKLGRGYPALVVIAERRPPPPSRGVPARRRRGAVAAAVERALGRRARGGPHRLRRRARDPRRAVPRRVGDRAVGRHAPGEAGRRGDLGSSGDGSGGAGASRPSSTSSPSWPERRRSRRWR